MRRVPLLVLLSLLLLAVPAQADRHGGGEVQGCHDRAGQCTDANVGEMSCMPPAGEAGDLGFVVGMQDMGQFRLLAHGTNAAHDVACTFSVQVDASSITFNGGAPLGAIGPQGGITFVSVGSCTAFPGETCELATVFGWWRADHGVTFDVPYVLVVNGEPVAEGEVHYFDPPAIEYVTGGPIVVN